MIRVCHMTSAHDPEDIRIFHKECVSLAKAGYEVYLVERGESYEKNGVHIVGVGTIPTGRLKRMTEGAKKVYEAAKALDAEIYHFHDPELLPYGLRLKKAGKKVIFDSHEKYTDQIAVKEYLPRWVAKAVSSIYGSYERHVLRKLDAVVIPSTLNGIDPFMGQCRHTAIISNAAVLDELFDQYDPNRARRDNLVCYVGGLTEPRGITNCMRAAHRAGAVLALGGRFSPPEYEKTLQEDPAYTCIEYRGLLDRSGVRDLLNQSSAGLCVLQDVGQYLKIETFGIKVYEYMSMGLPVILSHSAYNDRMMEKYKFGICVKPDNVEDIASAIRYLLDHPREARQMGENGRRAVQEEFNWSVEEKKLLALYEDILNEK